MSYMDRVLLAALEMIDITARDEDEATLRMLDELADGDVEAADVAQWLACLATLYLQQNPDWRALLDQRLAQARLIAAANLPDNRPPLSPECHRD